MYGYFNTLHKQLSTVRHLPYSIVIMEKTAKHKKLKKILLNIGFSLLESPEWILRKIIQTRRQIEPKNSVNVLEVSSSNVISFLREPNPLKEDLPTRILKTKIRDIKSYVNH